MTKIHFQTKLFTIDPWVILRLPEDASAHLTSRSQVVVRGTVNGAPIKTVLEPDGKWSHFFKVNEELQKAADIKSGDVVEVELEQIQDWPEPEIPDDLQKALDDNPDVYELWRTVTPMARWEWFRWINATKSAETRAHRIVVSLSKMRKGEKRPCCFNRAMCTDPYVSKGGRLLEPAHS